MTHESLWRAIDILTANNGMSITKMAKKAGRDESTFNPSKRVSRTGRPRWPAFDTINKALDVTNTSMLDFLRLACGRDE